MADFKPGQLVRSAAGRDCGRLYLVWELEDGFCLLTDGKTRKVANPKKKRPRHLCTAGKIEDEVLDRLRASVREGSTDAKIRKLLIDAGTQPAEDNNWNYQNH